MVHLCLLTCCHYSGNYIRDGILATQSGVAIQTMGLGLSDDDDQIDDSAAKYVLKFKDEGSRGLSAHEEIPTYSRRWNGDQLITLS